jgi:membrane protease YdiL (CAAX protease family)
VALRRIGLAVEYLALFFLLPVLFRLDLVPLPLFPTLWLIAAGCLAVLLASRDFDRRRLWDARDLRARLARAIVPFLLAMPLLLLATWLIDPQRLFAFVRQRPLLWAAVMILYPVLSAYPQGIVYRVFVFQRYAPLFPGAGSRILASAVAFALAHIVFRNWIAPPLSLAGGLLFAWTYERTGSSLVATSQHAAFGCWIFTIGLGWYFYYGAVR